MDWSESARNSMVENQIISRGIDDKAVICAMRKIHRHAFVPDEYASKSYDDYPLPVGEGQTISQPYIVALMSSSLDIYPGCRVLEVGTGSGYQAAILCEMSALVWTIEINALLADRARELLRRLGYSNINLRCGDGNDGWSEFAPFDRIIVTCSPSEIPSALVEQLADEGRMIIPVGGVDVQHLILCEKKNNLLRRRVVLPVRFVPMVGYDGSRY